ncbi:MAG TPA: ABC transporter ATP-binding protein [Candidatus Limnocylindria bacterium]|jgi:energy-coupling factor transport system ATP-binding protein|nr:ABC transporter ATP-binding protein [Candidatus Limnocylindria bacterium]
MTDLRLEGLTYRYPAGSVMALREVDLAIGSGQRVAIIGQNGSGKSTLVRHLNGLLRPTSGRVRHDGEDVAHRTVAQLARSVGLVFQDPERQIFSGSVAAEVEFGPRNLGLRGAALQDAVSEALARVGLEAARRTNPYDLGQSGRKLLTLASVLAMRTPVLVLDEPTTGQDRRGTEIVRRVVATASAEGRTVIAISHDMEFVASTFDRVVVLGEGRVVLDGTPAEVFAEGAWEMLRATNLEPPLPALIGARLGVGATPTIEALVGALRA